MDRLVVGSDAYAYAPLFVDLDERPTACDTTPTVAVTSARTGTTLTAPTAVAVSSGQPGAYRTVLTEADHTGDLDLLTLTWSGLVDTYTRTLTTTVEVAGGAYVATSELVEARAIVPDGIDLYTRARVWRTAFERLAERARGVAFVPRFAIETHRPGRTVAVHEARPREVLALWVDDVAQTAANFALSPAGILTNSDGSAYTPTGVPVVAYSHGHDDPPAPIVEACRVWVRGRMLADGSDAQRNVLSFTNLASGEVYRYGTSDWSAGRFTGVAEVDDLINAVDDERMPSVR